MGEADKGNKGANQMQNYKCGMRAGIERREPRNGETRRNPFRISDCETSKGYPNKE
jgi:hypothetical protein